MPTTARAPGDERDGGQTPAWTTLASMFVGQWLDKRAAIGRIRSGRRNPHRTRDHPSHRPALTTKPDRNG